MNPDSQQLIEQASNTGDHFTELRRMAEDLCSNNPSNATMRIGHQLFASEVHQARSLATYLIGLNSAESKQCLNFLRTRVCKDKDWHVQEILAHSFDRYCSDVGYKEALPMIKDWLSDSNPNVRRAVTEGLRIWTSRPYFKEHPIIAIRLLGNLRSDESEYVRKSVGNALRDISRKHKDLIRAELIKRNLNDQVIMQTYKLACKFL